MALFYADVAKRFEKFFDKETYELKRAVQVAVNDGKVNWTLKTELDAASKDESKKIDSKLTAKCECGFGTTQLETSVLKPPKFTFTTNQLPFANLKASFQQPKFETEISKQKEKFAWNLKSINNMTDNTWETEGGVNYEGLDKFAIGAKVSFLPPVNNTSKFAFKDYNVKLEWRRNADQTFVMQTEERLQVILFGGYATLRENLVGFGQVGVNYNKPGDWRWKGGFEKRIGDTSTVTALARQEYAGSLLYKGKINNFEGHLVYNCDLKKMGADKHSFEYKLCFNY